MSRSTARDLRRQGVVLLNTRVTFYDGRSPSPEKRTMHGDTGVDYWRGWHEDWTVTRSTPKVSIWARSSHRSGKVAHLVRYQLTATHKGGTVVKMTIWDCGKRSSADASLNITGLRRCWHCRGREKAHE